MSDSQPPRRKKVAKKIAKKVAKKKVDSKQPDPPTDSPSTPARKKVAKKVVRKKIVKKKIVKKPTETTPQPAEQAPPTVDPFDTKPPSAEEIASVGSGGLGIDESQNNNAFPASGLDIPDDEPTDENIGFDLDDADQPQEEDDDDSQWEDEAYEDEDDQDAWDDEDEQPAFAPTDDDPDDAPAEPKPERAGKRKRRKKIEEVETRDDATVEPMAWIALLIAFIPAVGLIAAILGTMGMQRIKRSQGHRKGKGICIIADVIGALWGGGSLIAAVVVLLFFPTVLGPLNPFGVKLTREQINKYSEAEDERLLRTFNAMITHALANPTEEEIPGVLGPETVKYFQFPQHVGELIQSGKVKPEWLTNAYNPEAKMPAWDGNAPQSPIYEIGNVLFFYQGVGKDINNLNGRLIAITIRRDGTVHGGVVPKLIEGEIREYGLGRSATILLDKWEPTFQRIKEENKWRVENKLPPIDLKAANVIPEKIIPIWDKVMNAEE